MPVVIAGDFNSDAILGIGGTGPDNTPAAILIEAAGYADTWTVAGSGPGPTWPLYLEDLYPPPFFAPSSPFERIDLIFSQGLSVTQRRTRLCAWARRKSMALLRLRPRWRDSGIPVLTPFPFRHVPRLQASSGSLCAVGG